MKKQDEKVKREPVSGQKGKVTIKNNLVRFDNCAIHIQRVVRLIFLAVFASFIGHIARYAPSSRDKNISKI